MQALSGCFKKTLSLYGRERVAQVSADVVRSIGFFSQASRAFSLIESLPPPLDLPTDHLASVTAKHECGIQLQTKSWLKWENLRIIIILGKKT